MPDELRSEILVPTRPHVLTALAALGCGALGILVGHARPVETHTVTVVTPTVQEPVRVELMTYPRGAAGPVQARDVRSMELAFVFQSAGSTYLRLADVGEKIVMPKHGKTKLVDDDGITTAVAPVQTSDVPEAYRRWLGRDVLVDGGCKTTVTGFAVVSRLTGDTGYAGIDDEKWTTKNVLEHGSAMLAAKVEAGCEGTWARGADLPAVIAPAPIKNKALEDKARAALLASAPARDTQREFAESGATGAWHEDDYVSFNTIIVRHPVTDVTWVSVHGFMEHDGCGGPDVNVWGLYRVEADGSLAAAQLRKGGEVQTITSLIDVDGDGELEMLGHPWLGLDTMLVRGSGEEIDRLSLAFFGCAC